MWLRHFGNLLSRAGSETFLLGGSTLVGVVFIGVFGIILVFGFTILLGCYRGNWTIAALKRSLQSWPSYAVSLLVMLFCWGMLFGYEIVAVVYNDHQRYTLENQRLSQKAIQDKEYCYQNTFNPPVPKTVSAISMSETWIVCPQEVKAPYSIALDYNEHPAIFGAPPFFPPDAIPAGMPLILTSNTGIKITVPGPSLPPWHGVLFIAYGDKPEAPKVVSFKVDRH